MKYTLSVFLGLSLLCPTMLQAQHSDVELGYTRDLLQNPTGLEFEVGETTNEGIAFFEADMINLNDPFPPVNWGADDPGFATHPDEGLYVGVGDQVWMQALDASTISMYGVGYVNFYNPLTDALEASGRIAIQDNTLGTADLILNGGLIEPGGANPQFIETAVDDGFGRGEIHTHLVFDLLDDTTAPFGAYGIMVQLQSDFATPDGSMDFSSDPFWLIFNHGMTESDFENLALPRFGFSPAAVPEPGLLGATFAFGLGGLTLVRRRRSA